MLETILFIVVFAVLVYWVNSGGLINVNRFLSRIANTSMLYFGLLLIVFSVAYPFLLNGIAPAKNASDSDGILSAFSNNITDITNTLAPLFIKGGVIIIIYSFAERLITVIYKRVRK